MTTKNTRNILKIKGHKANRWHFLRAHHLKSLIFQAFRKKTPSQDQGSFNFAKSNHFKPLQNQHPLKISTHKKCDAMCDASVMHFRKYSHHFSPNIRLWLRKNVFYYITTDGNSYRLKNSFGSMCKTQCNAFHTLFIRNCSTRKQFTNISIYQRYFTGTTC